MLDINLIRQKTDFVKRGVAKKNVDPSLVDEFLKLDKDWRLKTKELEDLKAEQNKISDKLAEGKDKELFERAKELKRKIVDILAERKSLEEKRQQALLRLPNVPFEDVVEGKDSSYNKVLREVGKKPSFDFKPQDYLTIAENLNIINVRKAAEVSGSRFGYIMGDAVLLEFALIKLAFDMLIKEGFVPVIPPVMVRPEVMVKMGKGRFIEEGDAFYIERDNLYLVGSSEHSIGPLHMDEVLKEDELPKRYVGFSTCFRREAGSYGKDTKGILRVHQFDKVEMFSFSHPDRSEEEHNFLVSLQEKLMKALALPYRVVEICTGDMGWADARQYDIETWLPSEEGYRETHSASNTTDYQARGVNARFKSKKTGRPEYLHMLNATAFAIGRMIIAIIENYQTKSGTVRVPKVLEKYMGKKEIS